MMRIARPYTLCALFAVLIALLLTACSGGSDQSEPTGSPSSSGTAASASTSPTPPFPSVTPFGQQLADKVTQIKAKVSEVRGLPIPEELKEGTVNIKSLQHYGLDQFASLNEDDAEDSKSLERILHALALVPDDYTIENYVTDYYGDIAGMYYPGADTFVLVGEPTETLSKGDEVILAHELTHAMQDARFDLEAFGKKFEDGQQEKDGYTSYRDTLSCLIEGDATFTMYKYAEAVFGPDWVQEVYGDAQDEPTPANADAGLPPFLKDEQLFNYSECMSFVAKLYNKGGWDAVNAAYENPPATTEQVVDFDKYEAGEIARSGKPLNLTTRLTGWQQSRGGQFGAFDVYAYLKTVADNVTSAYFAEQDWGAGWLTDYTDPADPNRSVVQLFVSFDSAEGLDDFLNGYAKVVAAYCVTKDDLRAGQVVRFETGRPYGPYAAVNVSQSLNSVEIHIASDEASLVAATVGLG